MFFVWMLALNMWATREDQLDPWAERDGGKVIPMGTGPALPKDRDALVA